jgi:hypothetical protein
MALSSITMTASLAARDEVRVSNNQSIIYAANRAEAAAGCAKATNNTGVKTVNTLSYVIDGAWQATVAATDPAWTLTGGVVPASSWTKWYLLVNAGGSTFSVLQGTVSQVSAASVVMPFMPQSLCVVGVLTLATAAATTFTPGTTALNATGITATFNDGVDPSSLMLIKIGQ